MDEKRLVSVSEVVERRAALEGFSGHCPDVLVMS